LIDDPSLTVRDASLDTRGQQPLRVVLDNELRMPLSAEMLGLPGKTLVYCINDRNRQLLVGAGAEVIKVEQRNALVDVGAVLDDLAARGINEVLVEAGPILCGSLIDGGFVDELVIYQAPHIMGSETRGMFQTPTWTKLTDRRALEITDVRQLGDDTRITAQLAGH
jgi:diaminohydroxyphosphoribosylaminopyrimidine deaminase/5-amino-6-(5-phosphoribosylamino)uracil reductase